MADDVTLKAVLIGEDRSLSKTMGKAGDSVDQVGKKSKLTGAAMKGALSAAVVTQVADAVVDFGRESSLDVEYHEPNRARGANAEQNHRCGAVGGRELNELVCMGWHRLRRANRLDACVVRRIRERLGQMGGKRIAIDPTQPPPTVFFAIAGKDDAAVLEQLRRKPGEKRF